MIPLKDDIPVSRAPLVTVALISANVAAFLWQLTVGLPYSVQIGGAIPYEVLTLRDLRPPDLVPPPFTVLSSMFLHGGWGHIAQNMLALWIFGNNVEDMLGRGRFVLFYLACGVAAAVTQMGVTAAAADPVALMVPMVGASGAIAGVLAGYMVLFPSARILTLVFVVLFYLPAALVIGLWFLIQLLSVLFGSEASTVAFGAHVGGFVTGYILMKVMGPRRAFRPPTLGW